MQCSQILRTTTAGSVVRTDETANIDGRLQMCYLFQKFEDNILGSIVINADAQYQRNKYALVG